MLSRHLLRPEEFTLLQTICDLIEEEPQGADLVFRHFRAFLQRHDLPDFHPWERKRLLTRISSFKYASVVRFYDFIISEYRGVLWARSDDSASEQLYCIDQLLELRPSAGSQSRSVVRFDPASLLPPNAVLDTAAFENHFLGYRISSRKGEIVRFGAALWRRSEDGPLDYWNAHDRGGERWVTRGAGWPHPRGVYATGVVSARSSANRSGVMRFSALERWRQSPIITGVEIADDQIGAIAARVVLIPVNAHDFHQERYQRLNILRAWADHPEPEDRIRIMESILDADQALIQEDEYDSFQSVIMQQTAEAIESGRRDDGFVGLWHFINNLTNTTLHGYYRNARFDDGLILDEFDADFQENLNQFNIRVQQQEPDKPKDLIFKAVRDLIRNVSAPM